MSEPRIDHNDLLALELSCVPTIVRQLVDGHVQTRVVSNGFCELFGFGSREEAIAATNANMCGDAHPDDVDRLSNALHALEAGKGDFSIAYRTRDVAAGKGYRNVRAQGKRVLDDNGIYHYVIWYVDEGPSKPESLGHTGGADATPALIGGLCEHDLPHTGNYDTLTGLPNTERFFELVGNKGAILAREGRRMATLFVNLSGMRLYNRKHGYAKGNELIRKVGRVLASHFENDNCGYLGQGCFGVITVAVGLDSVLHKVFVECRDLNRGRSLPIHVGIFSDESEDGSVVVSTALDRARAACKACANVPSSTFRYFSRAMLLAEEERQYVLDNFETALKQGWIQIYCQPLVRTANGRVCDEEALARWIDPNKGFLSPASFIPVLEEARLVYKLDLYVLEQILKKMHVMRKKGLYIVPSSFNLSRSDFEMCDMVEEVRRRVDDAGVSRSMITIEITESTLGGSFDYMKEQVKRFHDLGFSVWMDDFGSEYSSLDNLQRIPFDLIKLDRGFMREFNNNEKSKVILTELVRMAIALGVDTVAEGVETQEQVDFLREIGCSKLQGYYFSRPNSLEEILRRYETGIAIGFENPAESEYFSALGRINLYDLSSVAHGERESYGRYFDTLPMAVVESNSEQCTITRCNGTYRDFLAKIDDESPLNQWVRYPVDERRAGDSFIHALRKCAIQGGLVVVDDRLQNGIFVHALVRRVAQNPVTGVAAMAVAVLSITDEKEREDGVTFAHMARALAADYINLFYVNLKTDKFVEYSSNANVAELQVVRRGKDFFGTARENATVQLYKDDQEAFLDAFTKEKVVRGLNEQGTFTTTYRIVGKDGPVYVNLKAIRVAKSDSHVMVGISNVDAQMRRREAFDRMREERATYERVAALIGDFICIYTVDPATDHYYEYSATNTYETLGIAKEGEDFFATTRDSVGGLIHEEDLSTFLLRFTKQGVLDAIERDGVFNLRYGLVINKTVTKVNLRAAMVQERGGPRVIVGVTRAE